jgi:hypothetical protein
VSSLRIRVLTMDRSKHGLDPDAYRARWKLASDHPITAPGYSARRPQAAKETGLGRKAAAAEATPPAIERELPRAAVGGDRAPGVTATHGARRWCRPRMANMPTLEPTATESELRASCLPHEITISASKIAPCVPSYLPLRGPSFFLVGAPKAGTTSMNRYLALHPDIFMAPKELHYFSGEAFTDPPIEERDLLWYLNEFKRASNKKLIGEASVFYLSSEIAAYRIKQFNPDAKILIHVRNPTDLILSYHSALLYEGYESIQDIRQALMAETQRRAGINIPLACRIPRVLNYSEIGRLGNRVQHFFAVFGHENVHVNVFDDLASDPAKLYQKTLAFLGADDFFLTKFKIENSNKTFRSHLLAHFLSNPPHPIRALKRVIPRPIRTGIRMGLRHFNTRYVLRTAAKREVIAYLKREFAADVELLSNLLDRDLTYWSR